MHKTLFCRENTFTFKGRQIQGIYVLNNKNKKMADLLLGSPDGPQETWTPTFCHISETLKNFLYKQ
jgi:hypothetical protein